MDCLNKLLAKDPFALEVPPWEMPPGMDPAAPRFFGDSALDGSGQARPGGPGRFLAAGDFHHYAVRVPEGNASVLVTELESLSGQAQLFMEPFRLTPLTCPFPSQLSAPASYRMIWDRPLLRGFWSQTNAALRPPLESGLWYIRIQSSGEAATYRLRVGTLRPEMLSEIPAGTTDVTNQSLEAGEWHYFRWQAPENLADLPEEWELTYSWSQPMLITVRESFPPGDWNTGLNTPSTNSTNSHGRDGFDAVASWGSNSPGHLAISGRDLRPGAIYYVGIRAVESGQFNLRSRLSTSTLADVFPNMVDLPVFGGRDTALLQPGESRLWRVHSPAEVSRWRHVATHDGRIQMFLRRDYMPHPDIAQVAPQMRTGSSSRVHLRARPRLTSSATKRPHVQSRPTDQAGLLKSGSFRSQHRRTLSFSGTPGVRMTRVSATWRPRQISVAEIPAGKTAMEKETFRESR